MNTLYLKSGTNYNARGFAGFETGNNIQVKINSLSEPWNLPEELTLDIFYICPYVVYFPDSFTPEAFHVVNDNGGISILLTNRFNLTLSFT